MFFRKLFKKEAREKDGVIQIVEVWEEAWNREVRIKKIEEFLNRLFQKLGIKFKIRLKHYRYLE